MKESEEREAGWHLGFCEMRMVLVGDVGGSSGLIFSGRWKIWVKRDAKQGKRDDWVRLRSSAGVISWVSSIDFGLGGLLVSLLSFSVQ